MSSDDDALLALLRSSPISSAYSAAEIAGNISIADKQLNANLLAYFLTGFAYDIGTHIRLVQIDVWKKEGGLLEAKVVCEIEVTKGE